MKKLILALALTCTAGAALAAETTSPGFERGGYTLGPRLVYYLPADGDEGTWNPGVQARYFLGSRLALEGAADYQRHLFPNTTAHTGAFQASLLWYWGPPRAHLYLLGGGGFYISRVHGPNYRRNLGRAGPHLGFGGEWFFTPDWSVDLGYRHLWLDDLETRDGSGNLRSFKRSGEQLSLAVSKRFGAGERVSK